MNHPVELFRTIVAVLNSQFKGAMKFELVGSLTGKAFSSHDADIVVHTPFRVHLQELARGFSGGRIAEVDRNSTIPFPGRPKGQDRVRIIWNEGLALDLFFAKDVLVA